MLQHSNMSSSESLTPIGVEGIVLLFSANDGTGPVYQFPMYNYFKDAILPLLTEVRCTHCKRPYSCSGTATLGRCMGGRDEGGTFVRGHPRSA